ncbi:mechanosensitive ion channel [Flavobacterium sp. NST-5]|uniref:Mechanosensitive ion channel n=1 Tax=Flavobacterium ichthyis TaxID=2698827 RepID=A0ABW9ZAL9_9FLAO|nr:mechanosensitive ion channel domain-containing protein [Flavobacterium ichthyis]NBL65186.1 mechanosensitive ion channel [Flavobacterium ichthyis]
MIETIFKWTYRLLRSLGYNDTISIYGNLLVNIVLLLVIVFFVHAIFRRVLINIFNIIASRTKTKFDDFLVANKTAKYVAYLLPLYIIQEISPTVLEDFTKWEIFFEKGITIFMVFLIIFIFRSLLNSVRDYLKIKPSFSDKPIDSYIQVIMIVLWVFAFTSVILVLFDTSVTTLITTFGTISAIIILVFKDTILGFVASIQVSVNDLVRIGDWVTFEKFGADGDVIEINLATVKVQNFDMTTTTIPTYSLISDSFRNWRAMQNSGGRRIKRYILIKTSSVKFLSAEELEKLKQIQLVQSYIEHRQTDIDKFNQSKQIDKSIFINGRNMTNLGVFRKYINQYLEQHSGINKEMPLMCRHLQPTEKGIPIEIYAFCNDKRWVNYEYIMADIFDHLIAAIPYFGLEIFEFYSTTKQPEA